jgi:hypothetical protein
LSRIALQSSNSARISDGVLVEPSSSKQADIVNTGGSTLEIGVDAVVGSPKGGSVRVDTLALGRVWLRERAYMSGSVVSSGGIEKQNGVTILGAELARQVLPPLRTLTWNVSLPSSGAAVDLQPDRSRTLAPGAYASVHVKSRSTLSMTGGTYYLDSLTMEPQARLSVDTSADLVVVYVRGELNMKAVTVVGSVEKFAVIYLGTGTAFLEAPFSGMLLAHQGGIRLAPVGSAGFTGSFFAKDVNVEARTVVRHRPFRGWAKLAGLTAPAPTLASTLVLPEKCLQPHECCSDQQRRIVLTPSADTYAITGTLECIDAKAGDDVVTGFDTYTTLLGGFHNDVALVGQGSIVYGGEGGDRIETLGNSSVFGNEGDDTILVATGTNFMTPGPGRDYVEGGDGDDTVIINDVCEIVAGETLLGGAGSDTLITPLGEADLRARGVVVEGFENVIVKSDPCRSSCATRPQCSAFGSCQVDGAGQAYCACSFGFTGSTCTTPPQRAPDTSMPPLLNATNTAQARHQVADFVEWHRDAPITSQPIAREALRLAYEDLAAAPFIAQALVDDARQRVDALQWPEGAIAIDHLGFAACNACQAFLGEILQRTLPPPTPHPVGHGALHWGDRERLVALQGHAVRALALSRSESARSQLEGVLISHPERTIRAQVLQAYLVNFGIAERSRLASLLSSEDQILLYPLSHELQDGKTPAQRVAEIKSLFPSVK